MKKKILKTLSMLVIGLSLISIKANAGTWTQHQYYPPDVDYMGSWGYTYSDGSFAQSGWNYIDGEWYYFDDEYFQTVDGLQTINGQDYYFDIYTKAMAHDEYVKIGSGRQGMWYWASSSGAIDYNYNWCPEY
ncbi:hypothetical protein ACQR2L_12065 [Clostridium butyricum]|uniref:hypothetical protein n=1 Tax=Clostridium butyricum TaxID=1492 RepID=UPI003D0D5A77